MDLTHVKFLSIDRWWRLTESDSLPPWAFPFPDNKSCFIRSLWDTPESKWLWRAGEPRRLHTKLWARCGFVPRVMSGKAQGWVSHSTKGRGVGQPHLGICTPSSAHPPRWSPSAVQEPYRVWTGQLSVAVAANLRARPGGSHNTGGWSGGAWERERLR